MTFLDRRKEGDMRNLICFERKSDLERGFLSYSEYPEPSPVVSTIRASRESILSRRFIDELNGDVKSRDNVSFVFSTTTQKQGTNFGS